MPSSLCFSLVFLAGIELVAGADEPSDAAPIVIDEASPELRDVVPRLWAVAFSPDGKTLAATGGWNNPREPGELVLWDLDTRREKLIWRQEHNIPALAWSTEGDHLAIGDFSGSTKVLDPATGKAFATLTTGDTSIVNSVAFTPGGDTLVAGTFGGNINLWGMKTGKLVHTLSLPDDMVVAVAVSAEGRYLGAATWHGNAHVWDLTSREPLYSRQANQSPLGRSGMIQAIDFAPDGKTFVTGSWDTTLRIWKTADGSAIRDLEGHTTAVQNAQFSPNGKIVASSDAQGNVMLWDPTTGARIAEWAAHTDRCFGLRFSPDGKQLATAAWDRQVKVWDVETRAELASFTRAKP
jgi:WD40 repeat protein